MYKLISALIANGGAINDISLFRGKTGISLLFYQLSRELKSEEYERFAEQLLDEVFEEITPDMPLSFSHGLAGIGWAVEYLVQNQFAEANTDEILAELDNRLFSLFGAPESKTSGLAELIGAGFYFLARRANPDSLPFVRLRNEQLLAHLLDLIDGQIRTKGSEVLVDEFMGSADMFLFLSIFLYQTHCQSFFSKKVEKIRLQAGSLLNDSFFIDLSHADQLVMNLAIEYLRKIYAAADTNELLFCSLEYKKHRKQLLAKFSNQDLSIIKSGTGKIVWLYKKLFDLNPEFALEEELNFWLVQLEQSFYSFSYSSENKNFGIIGGMAGIVWVSQYAEKNHPETIKSNVYDASFNGQ